MTTSSLEPSPGKALPRKYPAETSGADPERGTDRAPEPELDPVHLADAGDQGHVGPDERHEAADHERRAAVLLEELDRAVDVLLPHDPAVVPSYGRTDGPAYLVADDVAQERRRGEREDADHELEPVGAGGQVQLVGGQEQAEREQQGVAGQEREQQPALDEDDDQADPDELRVEVVEQPVGVHPGDPQQLGVQAGHAVSLQSGI